MSGVRYLLLFITYFLIFQSKGQNVVLNPSFEDTIACPSTLSNDPTAYNWTNAFGKLDHFHICSNGFYTIPNNNWGVQDTCKGSAYAGVMTSVGWGQFSNHFLRNYLIGNFSDTLIGNQCYKVSFYYSLGEAYSGFAIRNFGIYVSDTLPSSWDLITSSIDPQIRVNQWMNDTLNWVKIERYFLAQGGENHIILGCFDSIVDTMYISDKRSIGIDGGNIFSHLYIDDVQVEPVSTLSLPQINLGADTILCEGEKLEFDSLLSSNPIYVWNNLVESSDSSFVIDSTNLYWVEAYNGCSYTSDTIYVEFVDPKVNLGADTTICIREELVLDVNYFHPEAKYLWNTGNNVQQIIPLDSGQYWVNVSVGHCEDNDTINIMYHVPENSKIVSQDLNIRFCGSGVLDVGSSSWNDIYMWNTEENTRRIEVTESNLYEVKVQNECIEALPSFDVIVKQLDGGFNPINIFTPNNDGYNDYFTIFTGETEKYKLEIYN